jgi:hypothetical protein
MAASKWRTVYLPTDLHEKIKETDVLFHGIKAKSMAQKYEFLLANYQESVK